MKPVLKNLRTLALTAALAPLWANAQIAQLQPPEIAAHTYMLVDVTANQVLASKDVDAPVEPASLTKLMTAYMVFDALRAKKITLEQRLPVSEQAWKMPGSRMFIDPKMQVPVEDLLKGMIVQSGNDATMALAEGVGGTKENFVRLMNEQAKALGMTGTSYKNPEGLTEPGHFTTARDLSILAMRLLRDFPEYTHYYAIKEYRYEGTPAANGRNRNTLLFRDPTVDGLKTGHTNAAGYCLVATANRDIPNVGSRRVLSILLGAASDNARANESQKLLNWGYTAYDAVKLFDAGQAMEEAQIWKGSQGTLKIGREGATVVTVPSGSSGKVSTQVVRTDPLMAPITKGQQVGTLKVLVADQVAAEMPIFALESVEEGGFFSRLWDTIRLWIR
ncbi:D-alanyl-D-alanine carboxypeptidase family protein [Comamonas sp.]|uniref:D-alanyl-D-alanine carboxypeptidase family protein n=1 Tax=Comamonas sp. TaxID=34028 RepID=UPI002896FEBC|nr:D-alanyl-D-alanine carboxypeptidase family protein [Comamonas sp.]